jgi:hypothetical protein
MATHNSSSSSRHCQNSLHYQHNRHPPQLAVHLLPQPVQALLAAAAAAAAAAGNRAVQVAVGVQAVRQTPWKQQQQQSWHRCSSKLLGTALLLTMCLNQCHRSLGISLE